jgi:hypothetical protein
MHEKTKLTLNRETTKHFSVIYSSKPKMTLTLTLNVSLFDLNLIVYAITIISMNNFDNMHENLHTVAIFHIPCRKLKLAAILDAILDSEVRTKRCSNSPLDSYTRDSYGHFGI